MFPDLVFFCAVCTAKESKATKIGATEVVEVHCAYDRPYAAKLEQGGFEVDNGDDQAEGSFDQPELRPARGT